MPQLNVAPSPSPVVAPPATANAAAPDASAAGGAAGAAAADNVPAQPFASVLRHQIDQRSPSERSAEKSIRDALAAVEADKAGDAAAQPGADAIAAIAQMLSGIVPPAPGQEMPQEALGPTGAKGKKAVGEDDAEEPVLLASAGGPAPSLSPTIAAVDESKTSETVPAAATAAKPAENFAAEGLENAASHAASTKEEGKDFAALLNVPRDAHATAALQGAPHAAPAAEASATHVRTPVGAHGWDNELGEKLTWLVNRHETRADLVLNPPQLGRIEVSISMNGDQASASFVSASPAVREALENAVPRLREILQDAGISLGQAQVGAESFQQSTANREKGDNPSRSASAGDAGAQSIQGSASSAGAAAALRRGNGLVDTFA